jgi:integrase
MTEKRRQRGTGRIFQKRGCARFTIQYYRNGKLIREATGSSDRKVAEQKLRQRLAQIATGTFAGPHVERVKVADLSQPYLDDLKRRGKGTDATERRWKLHLEPFFGWRRAATVGTDALNGYVNQRIEEKAAPATINREIAALRGMFRLGYFSDPPKLARLPKFPHCDESENVRKGFIELDQYRKMQALAESVWLQGMLEILHTYGWRKEEVLSMRVRQVDFVANVIRLDVGTTKNKEGREVPMRANVRDLLVKCAQGKQPDDRLFTREDGKPVRCFRKMWKSLCEAAGVPHLMIHDMRRTAARNLRRAGVTEGIIMSIGGWKTRSVFERYNITDQRDRLEALKKLEEAQNRAEVEPHQSNDAQKGDSGKQTRAN